MPVLKYKNPSTGLWEPLSYGDGSSGGAVPVSGVWGADPLDKFGSTADTLGQDTYLDSAGKIRTQPTVISDGSRLPTALIGTYPLGVSAMALTTSQATTNGWPGPAAGTVLTIRPTDPSPNGVGLQVYSRNNAKAVDGAVMRQASPDGWGEWWQLSGASAPWRMAAGTIAITAPGANAGTSVAVTFPINRFTASPVVTAVCSSNGYSAASIAGLGTAGVTIKYYNPTASVPSSTAVLWQAVQMTPTTGEG
jgi:hypothetical protein